MERATRESLTQTRIGLVTEDVPVEGVGLVTVRGLSRWEMLTAGKLADKGPLYMERAMVAFAAVDPVLNEDDVAAWQKAGLVHEMQPVMQKINELSGVGKGAEKSGVPGPGDEPDA